MNKILASLLLALLLGSAGTASADAETAPDPAADPMAYARGAKAWADTCARCHNLRDARDLRDDQWRVSVAHMRVRGHLTRQEAADITRFLQASN